MMTRKLNKLRYTFEEDLEDQEPRKYKGYLDEAYAADSTNNGGNANYAIMIYDVTFHLLTTSKGQEECLQAVAC